MTLDGKNSDPFDLQRFLTAQNGIYSSVLIELKAGQKRTHWMWFIFPQVDGLGMSETTRFYSIKSLAEAQAYLAYPVLGARLRECSSFLLKVENRTAFQVFGSPDDRKLQSSMTLFSEASSDAGLFDQVLEKFYYGARDARTMTILGTWQVK